MQRIARPRPSRQRQRGVATLLIVLMVGLAVSAAVATSVYALRGTQSSELTTHAATTAQANAWRGVEALRQYLLQVDQATWPGWVGTANQAVTGLDSLGVKAASLTQVQSTGTNQYQVTANVTGEAGSGSAYTTSTVQVVYRVTPGNTVPGTPPIIHSLPTAPMVFNGDLNISGGKSGVVDPNAVYDYKDIAVAGNLTIGGASNATISGCTKGNATLSGGGIIDNGHIYATGGITLGGMDFPSGTTLWGNSVLFGGGSGGPLAAIEAGAFQANVVDAGNNVIGTAQAGGKLIAGTVKSPTTIPWTQGTVLPWTTGEVVVTLTGGNQFLLDLGKVILNATTGQLTGAAGAGWLAGPDSSAQLPNVISFQATGIATYRDSAGATQEGGLISTASGASLSGATTIWGNRLSLNNGSAEYGTMWANGNVSMSPGKVTSLMGGGNFTGAKASCSVWSGGGQCSNFPVVSGTGVIAGIVGYGASGTPIPASVSPKPLANVQQNVGGTTPGLPGVPYCDARVAPISAQGFKSQANYVFQTVGGQPQLTIQNVKAQDGTSIDGTYPLKNPTSTQKALLRNLMTCNNTNDPGCLTSLWQAGSQTWVFNGVSKLPPGVLWFDAAVTVAGTYGGIDLIDGIYSAGAVVLSTAGHGKLIAPNFVNATGTGHAIADLCGAAYYPANLCASSSALVTWKDEKGNPHTGLPIGNVAILTEQGLVSNDWVIFGNVILGGGFSSGSSGNTVITGSLTVGSNQTSTTTMQSGGVMVNVPANGDLSQLPTGSGGTSPIAVPASATVLWSRYL